MNLYSKMFSLSVSKIEVPSAFNNFKVLQLTTGLQEVIEVDHHHRQQLWLIQIALLLSNVQFESTTLHDIQLLWMVVGRHFFCLVLLGINLVTGTSWENQSLCGSVIFFEISGVEIVFAFCPCNLSLKEPFHWLMISTQMSQLCLFVP